MPLEVFEIEMSLMTCKKISSQLQPGCMNRFSLEQIACHHVLPALSGLRPPIGILQSGLYFEVVLFLRYCCGTPGQWSLFSGGLNSEVVKLKFYCTLSSLCEI